MALLTQLSSSFSTLNHLTLLTDSRLLFCLLPYSKSPTNFSSSSFPKANQLLRLVYTAFSSLLILKHASFISHPFLFHLLLYCLKPSSPQYSPHPHHSKLLTISFLLSGTASPSCTTLSLSPLPFLHVLCIPPRYILIPVPHYLLITSMLTKFTFITRIVLNYLAPFLPFLFSIATLSLLFLSLYSFV